MDLQVKIYNLLKLQANLFHAFKSRNQNFIDYKLRIHHDSYLCVDYERELKLIRYNRFKYHLESKKIIKLRSNVANRIKRKYNLIRIKKSLLNNNSWLLNLPCLIRHEILSKLDYQSLVKLANAFPGYAQLFYKPFYWQNLQFDLRNNTQNEKWRYFSWNDIYLLTKYVNGYLKSLKIEINSSDFTEDSFKWLKKCLFWCPNLSKLELSWLPDVHTDNFIEFCCKNLTNLETLDIHSNSISDIHLDKLSTLEKLHSIALNSKKITDQALIKFFRSHNNIKFIDLRGVQIKYEDTLACLFDKHGQTIEALGLGNDMLNSKWIERLVECLKLKELSISGRSLQQMIFKQIAELKTLKALSLERLPRIGERAFRWLFSKKNNFSNLKRLHVDQLNMEAESFMLIPECCPNLEDLFAEELYFSDEVYDRTLERLPHLRSIVLKNLPKQLHYAYFRKIPKKMCNRIEFINIDSVYIKTSIGTFENLFKKINQNKIEIVVNNNDRHMDFWNLFGNTEEESEEEDGEDAYDEYEKNNYRMPYGFKYDNDDCASDENEVDYLKQLLDGQENRIHDKLLNHIISMFSKP